jgi:hypothetical protein
VGLCRRIGRSSATRIGGGGLGGTEVGTGREDLEESHASQRARRMGHPAKSPTSGKRREKWGTPKSVGSQNFFAYDCSA